MDGGFHRRDSILHSAVAPQNGGRLFELVGSRRIERIERIERLASWPVSLRLCSV
jgi:hypothetical protein